MFKKVLLATLFTMFAYAQDQESKVDCLILEDENSIICKYIAKRSNDEKPITVQWIDPNGEISRSRDMVIPSGHGSVYDYRYIKGRVLGTWTFKVIDQNKQEFSTQFELEASK